VNTRTANIIAGDQITDVLGEVAFNLPPSRAWRHQRGEFRLMAAVLEDALHVLRKRPHSRAWRETRAWLSSRDRSWPLSFESICDALDLHPDGVRRQVSAEGREVLRCTTDAHLRA
jgi:hypothetical protein